MEQQNRVKRPKRKTRKEIIVEAYNRGMTDDRKLAKLIMQCEQSGRLIVKVRSKRTRDESFYLENVRWYLSQAAKDGLIDREYIPKSKRVKKENKVREIPAVEEKSKGMQFGLGPL